MWRVLSSMIREFHVKVASAGRQLSHLNTRPYCISAAGVNGRTTLNDQSKHLDVTTDKASATQLTTGAFQRLPLVMPAANILDSALKKAKTIQPTKGIANIMKRTRNKGAKQLDTLKKELNACLRVYVKHFPRRTHLHPYERSLIELTFGDGFYEEVLTKVDALRKIILAVGSEHASLCAKSSTKCEAEERLNEGIERMKEILRHEGNLIDDLLNIAKTLRAMPVIDLQKPTLCLVGAPNVGKSSLVHVLSTGRPEICNYPFTTRRILLGHIIFNLQVFQVTDTPGLLKRCDEDRNNLERLTLAVLTHLPTAILYVHDLTGECGTSPSDQLVIYKEMKKRFHCHVWLDVISKCDLLQDSNAVAHTNECDHDGGEDELARYLKMGPSEAMRVSVMSGEGIDKLKMQVRDVFITQADKMYGRQL